VRKKTCAGARPGQSLRLGCWRDAGCRGLVIALGVGLLAGLALLRGHNLEAVITAGSEAASRCFSASSCRSRHVHARIIQPLFFAEHLARGSPMCFGHESLK
jgi:hypothetical protein